VTTPSTPIGLPALVTGGGRGVGKGIALELARAGYRVAVNYHCEPDGAAATVAEIEALGREAFSVRADVRSARDVTAMVETVLKRFGGLSVLVNNAGVQTWGPFLGVSEDDWDLVIDTNLKGTFVRLVAECLALLHV